MQSGSRSVPLACRPISGSRREEPCTPGFAKHLLTCAASHRRPSDAGRSPNLITSGAELRAEPDRKGVVFRRCVADEKSLRSLMERSNCVLKEQQRTRSEIAQDIRYRKVGIVIEEAADRFAPQAPACALSTFDLPASARGLATKDLSRVARDLPEVRSDTSQNAVWGYHY